MTSVINDFLVRAKVPSEFSHRTRSLEGGYKPEELRNLAMFMFPFIIETLPEPRTRKVWAYFAFIMRLYYVPDEEYHGTASAYRQDIIEHFVQSYLRTFGIMTATYTLHLILHLERIRAAGPFPEVSAIPFEAKFTLLQWSFSRLDILSTPNPIMSHLYKRVANGHKCLPRLCVSAHDTVKMDDRFLYIYKAAEKSYHFYKVQDVHGDEVDVIDADINQTVFGLDTSPNLQWARVGVF